MPKQPPCGDGLYMFIPPIKLVILKMGLPDLPDFFIVYTCVYCVYHPFLVFFQWVLLSFLRSGASTRSICWNRRFSQTLKCERSSQPTRFDRHVPFPFPRPKYERSTHMSKIARAIYITKNRSFRDSDLFGRPSVAFGVWRVWPSVGFCEDLTIQGFKREYNRQ